jgi:MFS family permease
MSIRTLTGLFLFVFAVLALTGPGRIDINDGQTRYEVARSLWEHGDVQIRDPDVWYPILKGPDGKIYTNYRLPHSVLGVPAIVLADLAGQPSEARRYFYFVMLGAVAGAVLAVGYAIWFAGHGCTPRAAIFWAAAGVFCTPSWFYSTSTFDDIFGATTVMLGLTWAWLSRERGSVGWALLAGLAVGAAVNWKPPLGVFLLPTLAIAIGGTRVRGRLTAIIAGLAIGLIVYQLYEWLRFPPGFERPAIKYNPPVWNSNPFAAAVALIISPSCGAIWYCPPLILGFAGMQRAYRSERIWPMSVFLACAGFSASICVLAFFKGNIAWGPRYLTPVFAVLWLFTPAAAARAGRFRTGLLLGLGVIVQLFALTTDPHRVYIVNHARPDALFYDNSLYYDLRTSHLFARPGEIWDVLTSDAKPEAASPAPAPTYALPPPGNDLIQSSIARRYYVFASLRPWWCWQRHLEPADRPVDIARTAALLLAIAAFGAGLTILGLRGAGTEP